VTAALLAPNPDWYLMRASGFVLFVLLTASLALGIANLGRMGRTPGARAVAGLVHRNVSLLATVFLAVHVLTAISDRFVRIPLSAVFIPGTSGYDPLWIGLGALAFDLMMAVVVTSLLRHRLRYRSWQVVHWMNYLVWPTALIHALGSGGGAGRDTGTAWSTLIYVACGLLFALGVAARLWLRANPPPTGPAARYPAVPPRRRPTAVTGVRPASYGTGRR
jgi:sulfoxide reductase heme-binding subunit YedZ